MSTNGWKKKKKKFKQWHIIVAINVVIVAIAVCVYFFFWKPNELKIAVVGEDFETIAAVIEGNGDVNAVVEDGLTLLEMAIRYNRPEVVAFLIKKGADVNFVGRNNESPLHQAVTFGSLSGPEAVILLVDAGADINAVDSDGLTPLQNAVYCDDPLMTAVLIKKGADKSVLKDYGSVLHEAAEEGLVDIMEFLIKSGADVNARDYDEMTPLHFAARKGTKKIIELLLKHGADVNPVDENKRTPLDVAKADVQELLRSKGGKAGSEIVEKEK